MSKVVKGALLAGAILFTAGAAAFIAPGLLATAGFWSAASSLAAGAFLSGLSAQLAGSARTARPDTGSEYSGTIEPRRIIYGELVVSGMHVIPPLSSGSDNRFTHFVLAIAGHEVNDITDIYFDRALIPDADITAITGAATDGKVTAGTFDDVAWVRRYLGTSSQTADYILNTAFTEWTSDHRGRGVAYVAFQLELDEEAYKGGKPEGMARVQGKKVYDPRLDSSPGAAPTNPSYIAYSVNPALCVADYLTDDDLGLGEDPDRIDWDMVCDAADICDELVDVPTASTQARYTCNIALLATTPYQHNIEALAACMLGSCLDSGGKWRIRAGAWEVPSFEITADNIAPGGIEVATSYPYNDRWNGIRGSFVDADNFYQADEFPAVQDATYVSDDGESVFKDMAFVGCDNVYEAQRNGIMLVRKSRNKRSAVIHCDLSAWKVRPGDTGIVTLEELGWVDKTVRCEGWKFNPVGTIELAVREELASDWDDPVEADYTEPLAITAPVPAYFTPSAPTGLAAQGVPRAVNLSWTAPALVPTGSQYEVWEYTSSTPFASASKVWSGIATNCKMDKSDTTTRYYWVRVVTADGTAGAVNDTTGTAGAAQPSFVLDDDAPADGTYGTGSISASPGFTDNSAIATVTWTNNTGATVVVEFSYSMMGKMNAADGNIFYRMYGRYALDASGYPETVLNIPYSATADTYTQRSGAFTVSVPNGVVFTGTARLGLSVPSGSAPSPPGVDYKDVRARVTALVL
jgi:hypothetical protein